MRKTAASWKTKKTRDVLWAIFSDEHLALNEDPGFEISKDVDFFIFGDDMFISKKGAFESVLSHKAAHQGDFAELHNEEEFATIFSSLAPLQEFVGENKIQLRRASAIRQKGYYKDEKFMQNLRQHHKRFGLNLTFDENGRIIPSLESCREIFQALLDHRLASGFSENIYDVPDATSVEV